MKFPQNSVFEGGKRIIKETSQSVDMNLCKEWMDYCKERDKISDEKENKFYAMVGSWFATKQ